MEVGRTLPEASPLGEGPGLDPEELRHVGDGHRDGAGGRDGGLVIEHGVTGGLHDTSVRIIRRVETTTQESGLLPIHALRLRIRLRT